MLLKWAQGKKLALKNEQNIQLVQDLIKAARQMTVNAIVNKVEILQSQSTSSILT